MCTPQRASTRRVILAPHPGDDPFVALPFETDRGAVAGLELDHLLLLISTHQPRSRAREVSDVAAHHDVAFGGLDLGYERRHGIVGIDRVCSLRGSVLHAELRGDALRGVDRPLLVAVEDA